MNEFLKLENRRKKTFEKQKNTEPKYVRDWIWYFAISRLSIGELKIALDCKFSQH